MILSLAFLLFILFSFFSVQFNLIQANNSGKKSYQHYLEMNPEWDLSKKEQIIKRIDNSFFKNGLNKLEVINKEESWSSLSQKLSLEFASNPLNHILKFQTEDAISDGEKQKFASESQEILNWKVIESNLSDKRFSLKGMEIVLYPLIAISLLLYFNILIGAVSSNLSSNKRVLESLLVSGAHHSKLSAVFKRNALYNFVYAFLIAVFLYIVSIYLIKYTQNLNFDQINISDGLKAILIPSILLCGVHLIVLSWKVDKYIKSV